jgi:hypothetical protein
VWGVELSWQEAVPTMVSVGSDGASYDVLRPGFDYTPVVYTDRSNLTADLPAIESWRYVGPDWREARPDKSSLP